MNTTSKENTSSQYKTQKEFSEFQWNSKVLNVLQLYQQITMILQPLV